MKKNIIKNTLGFHWLEGLILAYGKFKFDNDAFR